jgi:hypothetical protein
MALLVIPAKHEPKSRGLIRPVAHGASCRMVSTEAAGILVAGGLGSAVPRSSGRRAWRHARLVLVLAVVLAVSSLLISDVPATGLLVSVPPAPPAHLAPTGSPPSTSVASESAAPTAVDSAGGCLLGADPLCLPTADESVSSSIAPDISGPSSWTNITPPVGAANPPNRLLPAMTYYPAGHDVFMFGGYGASDGGPFVFYQDTWTYVSGRWTNDSALTGCAPTTCPSPRAGAMITYYPPAKAVVLFGGFVLSASLAVIPFNDTWLFENGAWTNITKKAGPAPSPRYEGAMVWDSLDNYALLFGGALPDGGTLGDTWEFNGTWHNLTTEEGSNVPVSRAGAAISNSPSGYLMLYGGESNGVTVTDYGGCGFSSVAWWFYHGSWVQMPIEPCIIRPATPAAPLNGTYPPCGRVGAALGWSPQNNRFVLFGGFGPLAEATCTGSSGFLNDTWSFLNPPGAGFNWGNSTDAGAPPARYEMGYASDFTDHFFEIFGGWAGSGGGLNDTWRYLELVHAGLTGPSSIETGSAATFPPTFFPMGFGGSGQLDYWFAIHGEKTGYTLAGTGCGNLTGGYNTTLPYYGTDEVPCTPTQSSYNVYRLTVHVWDLHNPSDQATANWTFTADPPQILAVYSQYTGDFYSGVNFPDVLGVLAIAAGEPAQTANVTIDGVTYYPTQRAGQPDWWNLSINIQDLSPGPNVVYVSATFAQNWDVNATSQLNVIDSPTWLLTIFVFPTVSQTLSHVGAGPYNESYELIYNWQWQLNKALAFALPIPLATGNYSLVPGLQVTLIATSTGHLQLTGGLSLAPPKISLGPVNLQLSAVVSLNGTFALSTESGQVEGITWESAVAKVSVVGKFSGSVPIYGFDVLGVSIGFTLEVEVDPAVALDILLAPTDQGADEFIQGIAVQIDHFFGSVALPLSVAVKLSIGFASVEIGGTIEVALELVSNAGPSIADGWVNGSIFVKASALFWSDTWNLVNGTIYRWSDPDGPQLPGAAPTVGYNNGTGTTWSLAPRYYAGAGYDDVLWNPNVSSGPVVSDIYPETEVTAATSPTGTVLFYTDDELAEPVQQGLNVAGFSVDSESNALADVPSPSDSGFVISGPTATTLPNGDDYVLWSALPVAETSFASPVDLSTLALHGAAYDPGSRTWGPVQRWTSNGLVQSYVLGASSGAPRVVALVSNSFLVGSTTPEHLVEFNLTSGTELANSTVTGVASLVALRAAAGTVFARGTDGIYSSFALASGTNSSLPNLGPSGSYLVSATYVADSESDLVLLYRGVNGSQLVLYDTDTGSTLGMLALGADAFEAEGIGAGATLYVFVRTSAGILGWSELGGVFAPVATIPESNVTAYGLTQLGGGILVYLLSTSGNPSEPTVTLAAVELDADLPLPQFTGSSGSATSGVTIEAALIILVVAAGAVALLLGVVAIVSRRRPPAQPPEVAIASPAKPTTADGTAPPLYPPGAGP